MWQILHASFWKFSKPSKSGISLNWSIIDEVTAGNETAYFFGPLCILMVRPLIVTRQVCVKDCYFSRLEYVYPVRRDVTQCLFKASLSPNQTTKATRSYPCAANAFAVSIKQP